MPLLVGLLDSSVVQRSLDIPLGVDHGDPTYPDIDLDMLADRIEGDKSDMDNPSDISDESEED